MTKRRVVRAVFILGFVLFLVDGAAAIWLGQLSGRRTLVGVGLLLLLLATLMVVAYRRWVRILSEVDIASRELHEDLEGLRRAASDAQSRRRN